MLRPAPAASANRYTKVINTTPWFVDRPLRCAPPPPPRKPPFDRTYRDASFCRVVQKVWSPARSRRSKTSWYTPSSKRPASTQATISLTAPATARDMVL